MRLKSLATPILRAPKLRILLAAPLLLLCSLATVRNALAQADTLEAKQSPPKPAEPNATPETYETIHLTSTTDQDDARDISTDLRNMLPHARIYLMAAQGAISVSGTPQDLQLARKIVADFDHARRSYRLTYTIYESENGKRLTSRKLTLTVAPGQKAYLRQGTRIPIVTGASTAPSADKSSQVQYIDIGLNIEASIEGAPDSFRLRTKVEQSSLADEQSGVGAQDPIIHQSVFEEASILTPGKPLLLGSVAVPGSPRSQEIEVVSELIL
jgi:type II secretory pathway component GspD/PulD (secretin)